MTFIQRKAFLFDFIGFSEEFIGRRMGKLGSFIAADWGVSADKLVLRLLICMIAFKLMISKSSDDIYIYIFFKKKKVPPYHRYPEA